MKTKLIGALLISTILIACNKGLKESPGFDTKVEAITTTQGEAGTNQQIPGSSDTVSQNQQIPHGNNSPQPAPLVSNDWNKKIIKTSTLRLEVKDIKSYTDHLNQKVNQYGGYVAQEDNDFMEERLETVVTIKVPVQFFEGLMNDLVNKESKVLEKNIKSHDVTGEVVDTKSRLEAKKQMRLKYLDFLKASKNMTEVLQVQNEINEIQEEIESASARLESLKSQSAYSTIHLSFFQLKTGYTPVNDSPSFFTRSAEAFKSGAQWFANLFIALISIWPVILVICLVIFTYRKTRPAIILHQKL